MTPSIDNRWFICDYEGQGLSEVVISESCTLQDNTLVEESILLDDHPYPSDHVLLLVLLLVVFS